MDGRTGLSPIERQESAQNLMLQWTRNQQRLDRMLKGITLTQREQDVLKLIANGLSDSEIAESLVLTVGTVKWYNRQIYNKLDVPNRTQALLQAQRLGLLPTDAPDSASRLPFICPNNLPAPVTRFVG